MYFYVMVILILIIAIPDIFFYRKLKDKNAKPFYIILHLIPPVFYTALFVYMKYGMPHLHNYRIVIVIMWAVFIFLLIYIPKIIHIVFYFLEKLYEKKYKRKTPHFNIVRITLTVVLLIVMLMSAYVTPRRFEVTHAEVKIKNLPVAFDGYRIVQISDIHLGSWNNKYTRFQPVIDMINQQNADIVVFTGDMVNNFAQETEGWDSLLLQIKAKEGKYAILGNHDYGDYTQWKSKERQNDNRIQIRQNIRQMGFRLLLNEHEILRRGNGSIYILGVENWGKLHNARYGDIHKALRGTNPDALKLLLSHDPTHWDEQIINKKDIVLTLSGHTHAAQMGIRLFGTLYSPASLIFKHWAGLYQYHDQYLYVNRGLGFIGIPMMIGTRPEITVITLKEAK